MRSTWLASALLLSAPILSCAAMDGDRSGDLRLTIGMAPGIREEKITDSKDPATVPDPANDGTVSMKSEAGLEADIGPLWRADGPGIGLVGGPSFFISSVRGKATRGGFEQKDKLLAYGLMVSFGPSLQAGFVRLEALPFVGIGAAHARTEVGLNAAGAQTSKNNSGEALYLDYGVRVGAYIDGQPGLIGVQLGYQAFYTKVEFDHTVALDSYKATITGSGIFAGLVAGVSF